ncbi:unnamed protein product [Aphanomyces euteiches]|nr:hypothetical protein AeRB84_014921 [Aphanomyces euteiches]
MVLHQTTEHVYPYSWDVVTRAFWNKYPNAKLAHVERVDVLSRYIDNEGRLHTARLAKCTQNNMPSWAVKILGKFSYVYEETICDPVAKTLLLKSTNLSYRSVATVHETCFYQPAAGPDGAMSQTMYTQDAEVSAFVPFVSQKLESLSVNRGAETAARGLSAMEAICKDIFQGQTAFCDSVPATSAPSPSS